MHSWMVLVGTTWYHHGELDIMITKANVMIDDNYIYDMIMVHHSHQYDQYHDHNHHQWLITGDTSWLLVNVQFKVTMSN